MPSSRLGRSSIEAAWLWPACRQSARVATPNATRCRSFVSRRPIAPPNRTSAIICNIITCPNAVSVSTVGTAASAAASESESAMLADSITSQAMMARMLAVTLACASRSSERFTVAASAGGAPAKALGSTRLRNASVPKAESSPATAVSRAMTSGAPPCRSKGGTMAYGETVNLNLPCVLCVSPDVTCQATR